MEQAKPTLSARVLRHIIRGIDAHLRHRLGIVEFERGADAVVRIAVGRAERDIALSDGTRLGAADRVLELHFWNEHLLTLPRGGATLRWATITRRQVTGSLRRLAWYLRSAPDLAEVRALRIRPAFARRSLTSSLSWIAARHGFESIAQAPPPTGSGVVHWLDSLWVWLLTWTYNPRGLRGRRFRRRRQEFWISRARFISLYGERPQARREPAAPTRQSSGAR